MAVLTTSVRARRRAVPGEPRGAARAPRRAARRRPTSSAAAAGRATSSGTARGAGSPPASASSCWSTRTARSSSCRRSRRGGPSSTSGRASSRGSASSRASSAWSRRRTRRSAGGAINPYTLRKNLRALEIARVNRLPMVNLVESGGADLPTQGELFVPAGRIFHDLTELSGLGIPTVALVFGNSTAGGAYVPGMCDYAVMVDRHAKVFLGGPPLVKMATGEESDDESLGGAAMHSRVSGLSDYFARDELDALRIGREIVGSLNWRKLGPGPDADRRRPPLRRRGAARHRARRPPRPLRPARGARPRRRRLAVRRVQAHLRHEPRHRLGVDPRLPGRRARQRPGRAVHGGGEEGDRVHHAREPDRHAARLPAEHDGLHGRPRLRAGGDHQGRRQDDQRGDQLDGPAPDGPHGRELRGGQLRHVRPRVRTAVPLRLAQLEDGGHGTPAARGRAVDRGAPERAGRRPGVRRGGRRRPARARSRPRSSARATRSSTRRGSTTTASSTRATRGPCSASRCPPCTRTSWRGAAATASSGCERRSARLLVANRARDRGSGHPHRAGARDTRPSRCAPTPTCTSPTSPQADAVVRLHGTSPADTYLRVDLLLDAAAAHRRGRRAPRLRVPLRARRLRPRLRGRGAHLRRAAVVGDRVDGLQDRGQAHDGGGGRPGPRGRDGRGGHDGRARSPALGDGGRLPAPRQGRVRRRRPRHARRRRTPDELEAAVGSAHRERRRRPSGTARCSSSASSSPPATSRSRSSRTSTAPSCTSSSASARSSAATKSCSRSRPRRGSPRRPARRSATRRSPRRRAIGYVNAGHGRVRRRRRRALLLPRGQHAPAGRAPRDRARDGPRPRRAPAPRRRGRAARRDRHRRRHHGARDRGPPLRRGPRRRLPPRLGAPRALRGPRGRGRPRRRGLRDGVGRGHELRRHARQGDRLGADAARRRAAARGRAARRAPARRRGRTATCSSACSATAEFLEGRTDTGYLERHAAERADRGGARRATRRRACVLAAIWQRLAGPRRRRRSHRASPSRGATSARPTSPGPTCCAASPTWSRSPGRTGRVASRSTASRSRSRGVEATPRRRSPASSTGRSVARERRTSSATSSTSTARSALGRAHRGAPPPAAGRRGGAGLDARATSRRGAPRDSLGR